MDPSTRFVRSLDGDYFMLREAAEVLGVSQRKLRDFIKSNPEGLGPSFATMFGKIKIYLYTKEDIDAIRKHLKSQRRVFRNTNTPHTTGRPAKWSDSERKVRQRLYSQSHYYRMRIKELEAAGDRHDDIVKAQKKVKEIDDELERGQHL